MKTHTYTMYKAYLSTKSINILGILELGPIFWMNLFNLEYFLTNKTQNMDLNSLPSEKIETIFFAMTRYSLLYLIYGITLIIFVYIYPTHLDNVSI